MLFYSRYVVKIDEGYNNDKCKMIKLPRFSLKFFSDRRSHHVALLRGALKLSSATRCVMMLIVHPFGFFSKCIELH